MKKRPAPAETKAACDHLATVHRDSGDLATRFGGGGSGTVIYVTRDPLVVQAIDRMLGLAPLPSGAKIVRSEGVEY